MQHDDVGLGAKHVERHHLDPGRRLGRRRVGGDDAAAEAGELARRRAADAAEADQPDRQHAEASDLRAARLPAAAT